MALLLVGTAAMGTCRTAPKPEALSIRPVTADEVLSQVRKPGARAVLVNVWATWCEPCRDEFPDLVRVYRGYRDRGVRLVLVSADFDGEMPAVRRFLAQQGVDFATYIKSGDEMKFINTLHAKWTGALPATLVYDGSGRLIDFWEGMASYAKLEQSVQQALNENEHPTHNDSTEVRS